MDPDQTLEDAERLAYEVRALVGTVANVKGKPPQALWDELNDAADSLQESFLALDEWLRRGGFLPKRWSHGPDRSTRP